MDGPDETSASGQSRYGAAKSEVQANFRGDTAVPLSTGLPGKNLNDNTTDLPSQARKPFDVFKDIYGVDRTARSSTSDVHGQHRRNDSIITSPLAHPNGVSMFPDLSVTEQEALSRQAVAQAEENIIADSDEYSSIGDAASDAGYGSDSMSSASTSIGSSVRDYMFENGRRYHSFRAGAYNFPNDDVEQEREDMKHAMVKLLSGQKLHFAPLGDNTQNVLDIGTGTGIWAIEMGEQYPSANVLGIDLSPIQPTWLPPNVHFMVDDVESTWLHPQDHFDYIHSRHTVQAIKNWPQLFGNALQHLKPGGWMELQEIHHYPHNARTGVAVPPGEHPVAQYWQYVTDGLATLGVDFPAAAGGKLAAKMQAAGFVNVTERIFHVPLGTWPKNQVLKTVGLYWRTILTDGLQAIALGPMTRGMGWSREQIEVFLVSVRRAYTDNRALLYMPMHIVYGQRPY
ncbi:methyltransferase [Fusarium heterosporum]|uniref:Methyltransferase n=1 Tax=Fusarium heterosporum TaxID=42747 RepID=A0A8H5TAQ7_FUSHE|nr:methyltransferase [Fusarium heterosporum]